MEDRDSVFVPKDLSKIKTKFLFGLTRRQCLFFGLGAAVGLPVFFLLRKSVSSTAASMLMMGVMLPFLVFTKKTGSRLKPCCARWLKPSGSDPGADRMKPTIPTPRSNRRCGSEKR